MFYIHDETKKLFRNLVGFFRGITRNKNTAWDLS